MKSMSLLAFPIIGFMFMALFHLNHAQTFAPAPPPTNDGTAVDQGVAYVLLLIALAVTYLVH
ncbi:hypothetical protein LguiA_019952 [Lonicera macranthoides]